MMVWVRYLRNHHGARAGDVTTMRHDLAQSFVGAGLLEFYDPAPQHRPATRVEVRTVVKEIHHHYHPAPLPPTSYYQEPELPQGADQQEIDRERRQRALLEQENARLRQQLAEGMQPRLEAPKSRRKLEPAEIVEDVEFTEVEKDPSKR
jgi:hypothetical protein